MKNWIAALACLLLLSACNAEEQEQPFSLTAEEQKACAEQIDAVMEEFYWTACLLARALCRKFQPPANVFFLRPRIVNIS